MAILKQFFAVVAMLAIVAGAVWADREWNTMRVNAKTTEFNSDVENLFTALQKYKEQVGTFPPGGNLEVAKALQGHNPKNVIVIMGNKTPINDKGEFLDPWGTPLRIYFSDTGILIRSAGPNRRFDDSTVVDADDYYRSN
jgi:hypothetical protein